jgi:ankyrin repeat protein
VRRDDPLAVDLVAAIRAGDLEGLRRLLSAHPGLAAERLEDDRGSGTPLHAATDWPGFFPRGAEVVRLLLAAGADPNAPAEGSSHRETPLHWAASSDDAEVAAALVAGGADIEAPGGSIGPTPLGNAVGYGCWQVAQLLIDRGARVERLWQAAALGLMADVERLLGAEPAPGREDINHAFWQACRGGQKRAAAHLLALGADPGWSPDYAHGERAWEAARGTPTRWDILLSWLRERGIGEA